MYINSLHSNVYVLLFNKNHHINFKKIYLTNKYLHFFRTSKRTGFNRKRILGGWIFNVWDAPITPRYAGVQTRHYAVNNYPPVQQSGDDKHAGAAPPHAEHGQLLGRGFGEGLRRKSGRFWLTDGKAVGNFVNGFSGMFFFSSLSHLLVQIPRHN